ncbi:sulfatase-like hydrolase/transferase [bacterium]|nr:sulfatase-like hydrolase/transferase [bacterium]
MQKAVSLWKILNRDITVGIIFSLSIGFFDLLATTIFKPARFASFSLMLTPLIASILIAFLVYLVLSLLLHLFDSDQRIGPLNIPLAAFLASLAVILQEKRLISRALRPSQEIMMLGIAFILSFFVAFAAHQLMRKAFESERKRWIEATLFALPVLICEMWLITWRQIYHGEPLFSSSSILLNGFLILCCALSWLGFYRTNFRAKVRIVRLLAVLTICSPLLGGLQIDQASASAQSTSDHLKIRHVMLITIDTLRADTLAAYGGTGISTTEMDQLASGSTVFSSTYAVSPWTLPSAASLLTGHSPLTHQALERESRLPENLPTLAEYMQNAGYKTEAIGDNVYLARNNFSKGFDEFNIYPKSTDRTLGTFLLNFLFPRTFRPEAQTSDLTDMAIDWLKGHHSDPFFLWLHYFDPHIPYSPPASYLPTDVDSNIANRFDRLTHIRAGHLFPSSEEKKWIQSLYLAEVRYVDDQIGKIVNEMKELGIYDETLLILTSDHGEEFWEHGGFEHGHSHFEELLRVPLIVKLPGSKLRGVRIDTVVSGESVTPTILDLCGIPYHDEYLSRRSLFQQLSGEHPASQWNSDPIIVAGTLYYEPRISVIFNGLKYTRLLVSGNEQTFNLREDPHERQTTHDRSVLETARQLLSEKSETADRIRQRLGLKKETTPLNEETEKQLKALGYLQ